MAGKSLLGAVVGVVAAVSAFTLLVATSDAARTKCSIANAGTSQRYSSLQEAVNGAESGDTLSVRGVCTGDTTIDAKSPAQLTIAGSGRAVLDGRNSEQHPGPVLRLQGSFGGPPPYVTITGLEITGGWATGEFPGGGGIEVVESGLTLDESTVTGNVGGGIGNGLSNTTLNDSRVLANSGPSENGGGIRNAFGTLVLNNSIVGRNASGLCGGGIYDRYGTVRLTGSVVRHNSASGDGGGICGAEGSTVALEGSSSVVGNRAGEHGGGIYSEEAAGGSLVFGPEWSGTVSRNHPDNIFRN